MYYADHRKSLLSKVFEPSNFAVLASVGVHSLVLGLFLPTLTVFAPPDPELSQRTVNVVELNAIEENRLPDFSPLSLELPSLDNMSLTNQSLDSLSGNSLPSGGQSLPSLDNSLGTPSFSANFNNNYSSLSSLPVPSGFPYLPPPPLPTISANPFPQTNSYFPEPSTNNSNDNINNNINQGTQQVYPQEYYQYQQGALNQPLSGTVNTPQIYFPPSAPTVSARDLINQKYNRAVNSQPQIAANSLRDNNQNTLTTDNNNNNIARQNLIAAYQKRSQSLQQDKTNTSDEEARRNYVNWLGAVKTEKPQELNIVGIYPKDACLRKLQGTSIYGVLVNSQGRANNIDLIKSSGYPIFNQQALQQIKTTSFTNESRQLKPYRVNITFNYEPKTCPSLAVTSPTRNNANTTPTSSDNSPPDTNNISTDSNPSTIRPTPTKIDKPNDTERNTPRDQATPLEALSKPTPSKTRENNVTSEENAPVEQPTPTANTSKPNPSKIGKPTTVEENTPIPANGKPTPNTSPDNVNSGKPNVTREENNSTAATPKPNFSKTSKPNIGEENNSVEPPTPAISKPTSVDKSIPNNIQPSTDSSATSVNNSNSVRQKPKASEEVNLAPAAPAKSKIDNLNVAE